MENHDEYLDQFRNLVYPELISKGVRPPASGSNKEAEMFQLWLKGEKLLEESSNE